MMGSMHTEDLVSMVGKTKRQRDATESALKPEIEAFIIPYLDFSAAKIVYTGSPLETNFKNDKCIMDKIIKKLSISYFEVTLYYLHKKPIRAYIYNLQFRRQTRPHKASKSGERSLPCKNLDLIRPSLDLNRLIVIKIEILNLAEYLGVFSMFHFAPSLLHSAFA